MALLGNYSVLHKLPLKFVAGSTTSVEGQLRSNFDKSGNVRKRLYQDQRTTAQKLYAVPTGNYAGIAWLLPQSVGEMTSHSAARASMGGAALAVGGITSDASADFAVSVADMDGQLISSGQGSALFTVSSNTPLLTASLNAIGSALLTLTGNATPSADGYLFGSAAMSVTQAASILPVNDASPLRTGEAVLSLTGVLVPYAIGSLSGDTESALILTVDSIATAVWNTLATTVNAPNTTGNKLNTASSGGVDMAALVEAVLTDPRFKNVLTTPTFIALKD